jgi:hypothetical protein
MKQASGGCVCGHVRFDVMAAPMITHACHCTWCQRETGGPFAINALIETSNVTMLRGQTHAIPTPTASGRTQTIHRCPRCHVALWSHYPAGGLGVAFLRVGALDAGHGIKPDIHIFTSTKVPWLDLPKDAMFVPEFYSPVVIWSEETKARYAATR